MDDANDMLRRVLHAAGEVLAETLWPTRCVLCERPGAVLCERCAENLPYLDQWRACPRCGAAYGAVQCTSCDAVSMARLGRSRLPFDGCAAATMFDDATGRIVRAYKDHGERRLVDPMADCLVRCLPPAWRFDAVTYIPATLSAVRYRGFDHARLLAGRFAEKAGHRPQRPASHDGEEVIYVPQNGTQVSEADVPLSVVDAFARPETRDQRKLSRGQRFLNTAGRFRADPEVCAGRGILLIDDVSTTGATLLDASDALLTAGAACVYCMTFARV